MPTGDYSVGMRRVWTSKNSEHAMVYYPVRRLAKGIVPMERRPAYKPWGVGTWADKQESLSVAYNARGPVAAKESPDSMTIYNYWL